MKLKDIQDSVALAKLPSSTLYELQQSLFELGYRITVDGIYGEETQTRFNQFKTDNRLTQPDRIGKTTVDMILKLLDDQELLEHESLPTSPLLNTPNIVKTVNWEQFNPPLIDSPLSRWFMVGEAFNNQIIRVTNDPAIRQRIVTLAKELDKIRDDWGSAIGVTSWYRPPFINRKVGGASNSRHLYGDAVDIYPINGNNIHGFQSWLDKSWHGALGYGASKGFVHLDMRNGKGWKTGGNKGARWNY